MVETAIVGVLHIHRLCWMCKTPTGMVNALGCLEVAGTHVILVWADTINVSSWVTIA
jgi:hypothetical protein